MSQERRRGRRYCVIQGVGEAFHGLHRGGLRPGAILGPAGLPQL